LSRVGCFDKRGTGVSDPVPLDAPPTLEEWMDHAVVAIDAAGVHEVAVIGDTEGGRMALLLALHTARSSRYTFAAVSGDALGVQHGVAAAHRGRGELTEAPSASMGRCDA
jgi:pimeloyl-ACP methyl ester carboxylesterase